MVKFGGKLLFTGSLLLLALAPVGALSAHINAHSCTQYPYEFVSGDAGAYVRNWRYAAQLLYDPLNDPENPVGFPGKADIFR